MKAGLGLKFESFSALPCQQNLKNKHPAFKTLQNSDWNIWRIHFGHWWLISSLAKPLFCFSSGKINKWIISYLINLQQEQIMMTLKDIVKEASRQKFYLDRLISLVIEESPWLLDQVDANFDETSIDNKMEEFCWVLLIFRRE